MEYFCTFSTVYINTFYVFMQGSYIACFPDNPVTFSNHDGFLDPKKVSFNEK